jgi:hypothetical protein
MIGENPWFFVLLLFEGSLAQLWLPLSSPCAKGMGRLLMLIRNRHLPIPLAHSCGKRNRTKGCFRRMDSVLNDAAQGHV